MKRSKTTMLATEEDGIPLRHQRTVSASASRIDPATLTAYRRARYEVREAHHHVLQVDTHSAALQATQRRLGVDCSAFLSACNPRGRLLAADENMRRHAALLDVLKDLSLKFQMGFGADPEQRWPGEASVLVHGIGLAAACELGSRLEQNALLWAGADAIPRLILLR